MTADRRHAGDRRRAAAPPSHSAATARLIVRPRRGWPRRPLRARRRQPHFEPQGKCGSATRTSLSGSRPPRRTALQRKSSRAICSSRSAVRRSSFGWVGTLYPGPEKTLPRMHRTSRRHLGRPISVCLGEASARPAAVLAAQDDRAADRGGDVSGVADVQRQAGPASRGPRSLERRKLARPPGPETRATALPMMACRSIYRA